MLIINPKRINDEEAQPNWYNYYAGYSHAFTRSVIQSSGLSKKSLVLDPWNGAGTTTLIASECGLKSIGIDLNPAMKIISKAKQANEFDAILAYEKISLIKSNTNKCYSSEDFLFTWFDSSAVESIRKIESVILDGHIYPSIFLKVNSINASQCLMYVALFNCIRHFLKKFIPSNPTWIKKPKNDSDKISISWGEVKSQYCARLHSIINAVKSTKNNWSPNLSQMIVGSSTMLPLKKSSVDMIVTSPPYCTRIDYGIATLPELSILSVEGKAEIDVIRRSLMGTTTVVKAVNDFTTDFGETCNQFLTSVWNHNSKASQTYYYKNLSQYFKSLKDSILEIDRVLKKNSKFICVVQDSYYKDIHCDLPMILADMAQSSGLLLTERIEFETKQNMVNLNQRSKLYKKNKPAFENVLIFSKGNV